MSGLIRADGSQHVTLTGRERVIVTLSVDCTSLREAVAVAAGLARDGYSVSAPTEFDAPLGKQWRVLSYREDSADRPLEVILPGPQ